ncbi:MAG: hypothetical protein PF517_07500 [Salinivirgaceae bacterium]|jgi:WD40 repeat protein|nr:hypothetical protein [Salinivirgaceae bacterium]
MESITVKEPNNISHNAEDIFNPFPGLRPFSTDESHLFFGREGQSQEVLKFLAKNRFVGLLGTSGSGKSSLMYCGVIPIMQGGFITKAGADWNIITCRPGQNPIKNLANSLSSHFNKSEDSTKLHKEYINTTLSASSLGLVEVLKQIPRNKSQNILLLVDQFEELFRFRRIKKTVEAFNEVIAYIKLLLEVLHQEEVPAYIVITMRSDFIGECAQFQELTKLINDSHYLIPQMTRDDFREAIEGPIAVGGGTVTPFLIQQLLNDIGDNPDQLPILQHALMRTWDAWTKTNHPSEPIDIKDYENIGKLEKALSEHANEAYNELSQSQKEICQSIFKTLTEKGGDNRGVRRPTPVFEIAEIANTTPEMVIEVVEHFRLPGRSFLSPAPPTKLTEETVIDISHESLMRIWDKLIVWVSEEYEAVQMYKRLADSAEKFQLGETSLWRPPDLLLALSWRDKQKPTLTWAKRHNAAFERTMVYLETSDKEFKLEEENKIKQQKKALRRTRVFAIVLGSAAIISLYFMFDSFIQKNKAEEQKIEAENQKALAQEKEQEAVAAQKNAEEQRQLALESEQEALKQKELANAERSNAENSARLAQRQKNIANQKSIEAEQQKAIAEESADEAKRAQQNAEVQEQKAQQLRMLSISQSMAVKSLQINIDTALRGLVAYQAYVFNKNFNGQEFNPDVYNGLYYSHNFFYSSKATDYEAHNYQVRAMEFDENSKYFYSTGSDGKIMKLNLSNIADTSTYFKTNEINRTLCLSLDNKYLLAGLNNGALILFNLSETPVSPELIYSFPASVNAAIYENEKTIIAFDNQGNAIRFNTESKKIETIENSLEIKDIDKINNNYLCVSKSGLFHKIESFTPLKSESYYLSYSPDGKSGILQKVLDKQDIDHQAISAVTISHDNNFLAIGDKAGNVLVFDNKNLEFKYRLTGQTARINSLKFDDNTDFLASASQDGSILIWSAKDFNLAPYNLIDNDAWVMLLNFVDNSNSLIAAYADGKIRKWPIKYHEMANQVKGRITRNFTSEEWQQYTATDIKYEKTISELP